MTQILSALIWSKYIKFQAIQNDCNKKLRFVVITTNTKWKAKLKKNRKLQIWLNPELMLRKSSRGIIIENKKWLQ